MPNILEGNSPPQNPEHRTQTPAEKKNTPPLQINNTAAKQNNTFIFSRAKNK